MTAIRHFHIPTAIEIMPTPEGKQLFEVAFAEQVMGRPFVMPSGSRPTACRCCAPRSTRRSRTGLAGGRQGENMEIDPVTGAAINALLDRVYTAPPELAARLREMAK